MRSSVLVALLTLAIPITAASSDAQHALLDAALLNAPSEIEGIHHSATSGLDSREIAIDDQTRNGAPERFGEFANDMFGRTIAEELVRSYRTNLVPRPIDHHTVRGHSVVPLQQFATDRTRYDWTRLTASYPDIRAVVRVSSPAMDETETIAVVRYEAIGPDGRAWASFRKFERQRDGSWRAGVGRVGDIWD